jgi:hypothetical protein
MRWRFPRWFAAVTSSRVLLDSCFCMRPSAGPLLPLPTHRLCVMHRAIASPSGRVASLSATFAVQAGALPRFSRAPTQVRWSDNRHSGKGKLGGRRTLDERWTYACLARRFLPPPSRRYTEAGSAPGRSFRKRKIPSGVSHPDVENGTRTGIIPRLGGKRRVFPLVPKRARKCLSQSGDHNLATTIWRPQSGDQLRRLLRPW